MLSRSLARSLMSIVPEKGTAVVTLDARTGSPTTVTVYNAWIKQTKGGLSAYGNVNTEQDKTIIKIPDIELNPTGNGRQIRAGDTITFGGNNYRVTGAGGNLRTVRTVWDCDVQQEFPSS